ncbi:family 16 glycosylhydrolase [Paraglaciecola sp.]|uniref:family 16 glycosylhydrolase n=1 Tax=Paraglaciecola sp. TaxID=1920173 RepID=UPI003EF69C3B
MKYIFITLLFLSWTSFAKFPNPLSDPENSGTWLLNPDVSDEFDGDEIDTLKWFIQGTNKQFHLWKGRAPSQFAPHNVYQKNGKLNIRTQWQPEYDFIGTPPERQVMDAYENITTGALISHNTFLYGYMEVKVKIPDAAMTGAFWGIGYQQELDIFELVGRVKKGSRHPETTFVTSIHDWRPGHPKKNKVWKHAHKLTQRTAEAFQVYGVEWSKDSLKMYLNGELIHQVTQQEMGEHWLLNNPLEMWLDSEVFPWHGVPDESELPVNFEIEYVRVWQQPTDNLLDEAFYGFEGPFVGKTVHKPIKINEFRQFWWMDDTSAKHFSITDHSEYKFSTGRRSLKFSHQGHLDKSEVTAFAPNGSVDLEAGSYSLNFKLWLQPNSNVSGLNFILESPWLVLPKVDLTKLKTGQWLDMSIPFIRSEMSTRKDRLRVVVKQPELLPKPGTFYIDDINISKQ